MLPEISIVFVNNNFKSLYGFVQNKQVYHNPKEG